MVVKANQDKVLLHLYNLMSGDDADDLCDIPVDTLKLLYLFDYHECVKPLIRLKITQGLSLGTIAYQLGANISQIKKISAKMKRF